MTIFQTLKILCYLLLPGVAYFYMANPFFMPVMFLYAATLIAIHTPTRSPYRLINFILVGEFLLSIGIDTVIWNNNGFMPDPVMFDLYKVAFNSMFYLIFVLAGGFFLSGISLAMAIYHSARMFSYVFNGNFILEFDYELIITIFCILQLACVFRGMLYGLGYSRSIDNHRINYTHDRPA